MNLKRQERKNTYLLRYAIVFRFYKYLFKNSFYFWKEERLKVKIAIYLKCYSKLLFYFILQLLQIANYTNQNKIPLAQVALHEYPAQQYHHGP